VRKEDGTEYVATSLKTLVHAIVRSIDRTWNFDGDVGFTKSRNVLSHQMSKLQKSGKAGGDKADALTEYLFIYYCLFEFELRTKKK